jgi:hypothetical protein
MLFGGLRAGGNAGLTQGVASLVPVIGFVSSNL